MCTDFAVLADDTVAGYCSDDDEFHIRSPFDRSGLCLKPWRAYAKEFHFRFDFFPLDVALHLLPGGGTSPYSSATARAPVLSPACTREMMAISCLESSMLLKR